jgi:hypothetical protein
VKARAGLLARRDFRLLWTGETTSCLGSSISGVALPLVALSVLHASVFAVSALTAAAWLPWVLVGLPAGERHPCLGLGPRRPQHRPAFLAGGVRGCVQQRRLADARRTDEQQAGPAVPAKHRVHRGQLVVPADQLLLPGTGRPLGER